MNITAKKNKLNYLILITTIYFFNFAALANLEERLTSHWNIENIDVDSFNSFADFLSPNEQNPYPIKMHLDLVKKDGLLVSTGTERSFIALALCQKCTGLVGVDINPRVKAYNDFNMLLLKLARDRRDYLSLRAVQEIIAERFNQDNVVANIKNRLSSDNMLPPLVRDYYVRNFDQLARIFFRVQGDLNHLRFLDNERKMKIFRLDFDQYFNNANYLYDDTLFLRLKNYAEQGNVVFTIGTINDLQFLDNETMIAIDVSNIADYGPLTYESNEKIVQDEVRIIWAISQGIYVQYNSYIPRLKDEKLQKQYDDLVEKISTHTLMEPVWMQNLPDTDNAPLRSSVYHYVERLKLIVARLKD